MMEAEYCARCNAVAGIRALKKGLDHQEEYARVYAKMHRNDPGYRPGQDVEGAYDDDREAGWG